MTRCHEMSSYIMICHDLYDKNSYSPPDSYFALSIAILFYRQPLCSINSYSPLSIATLLYRQLLYSIVSHSVLYLFCSFDSNSILLLAILFYQQLFCSINAANIFELHLPSKDGNITPEQQIYITRFGSQRMILNGFKKKSLMALAIPPP